MNTAAVLSMRAEINGRRVMVYAGTVTVRKVFATKRGAERRYLLMQKQPCIAAKALLEWEKLT